MANGTFNLNVKTKADLTELNKLKAELQAIRALMSNSDYTKGMGLASIREATQASRDLEKALSAAYDVKLNTVNIDKFNKSLKDSGTNLGEIQKGLTNAGAAGQKAFVNTTTELLKFNKTIRESNQFLDKMATTMANTVRWSITSTILNNITGSIEQAVYYIKDLDTGLNDIRIVTGKSADEMARFAIEANNAAKALAVSTSDYTEGSLIYYQQGLDDKTVKTLTDITAMTSNVTGQSMSVVSEQLTAVWNGYQVANEAAAEGMQVYEEYVDKMAAVGAATASDLEELATAMSKVASAANVMGVDFDQLSAQIATIVSVTRQAPEQVGTALKTIYARLGDLKIDGVDEFGVTLGAVSNDLKTVGIEILDSNGELREMGTVIEEVAEKWNTWNSAQKQAVAISMAGKRQYNNLLSLFENWDMYTDTLNVAANAAGTLDKQQSIALDSLKNKLDILRATSEDLYDNLFDEETMKDIVDGFTSFVQVLADVTDALNGLESLLPLVLGSMTKLFSTQISKGMGTMINNLSMSAATDYNQKAAQDLSKMYENQVFKDQTGLTDSQVAAVKEMTNYYADMYQKMNLMSDEEIEIYHNILDMKNEIINADIELEKLQKNYSDFLNTAHGKTVASSLGQLVNDEDVSRIEEVKRLLIDINKKNYKTKGTNLSHIKKDIDTILSTDISNLYEINLTKIAKDVSKASAEELEQAMKITIQDIDKYLDGYLQIDEKKRIINFDTQSLEGLEKPLNERLKTKETLDEVAKIVGSVGQLFSSIQMIQNLGSIWSDETLSDSEKLSQILTNLSFLLFTLKDAFKALGITEVFKAGAIALWNKLKAAIVGTKVATDAAAASTIAFNTAMKANVIGLVVTTLTTLIGIINLYIDAKNREKEAEIEANKELLEEAKVRRQEEKSLNDSLNAYMKAYKTYQKTGKGKEELISTTDNLINSYNIELNSLNKLIEKYGYLKNAIIEANTAKVIEEQKENLNSQIKQNKKDLIYAEKNLLNNDALTYGDASGVYQHQFNFGFSATENTTESDILIGLHEIFSDIGLSSPTTAMFSGKNVDDIVKLYDELDEYYNKILNNYTDSQLKDSELDDSIKEWLNMMKEDVEEYKSIQQAIQSYTAQNNALDISTIENYSDYLEKKNDLIEKLQLSEEYKNKSDVELAQIAETALMGTNPEAELYAQVQDKINDMMSTAWNKDYSTGEEAVEYRQQLEDYFNSLSETELELLFKIGVDKAKTMEELKALIKEVQIAVNQADIDTTQNAIDTLLSGKELTDEQIKAVESITGAEERLGAIRDKNSNAYLEALQEINQELEDTLINQGAEKESELISQLETIDIDADDQAFRDKMDEILEANYETSVNIKADIDSDFNNITQEMSNIKNMASKIGEDFIIAAEDIQELNNAFPGILAGITYLHDGTVKLNEDSVRIAMNTAEAEIAADSEATVQKLENEQQEFLAKAKAARDIANLATQMAKGEVDTEEEKTKLKKNLANAFGQLQTDISNETATNQVEDEATVTDSINENSSIGADNIAKMYDSAAHNSQEYANQAIANIQKVNVAMAGGNAGKGNYSTITSYYDGSGGTTSATGDLSAYIASEGNYEISSEQWQAIADEYNALADYYDGIANDIEGMQAEITARENNLGDLFGNIASGKGSNGSDSKINLKDLKEYMDEFDRYWEINKSIEAVTENLDDLSKVQDHLFGKELITSLEKENELLDQQAEKYKTLFELQKQEASELQSTLSQFGVIFDAEGGIANYASITQSMLAQYNAMVAQHNSGTISEETFDTWEKDYYEKFQKALERYEELFYGEMVDVQNQLDDIYYEQLANNLEAWEVEIELNLELNEAEREWSDFLKEINDDFKATYRDIGKDFVNIFENMDSYGKNGGTIAIDIKALKEVEAELAKLQAGESSDIFASVSEAEERVKELKQTLMEDVESVHDLWVEAWDAYMEGIDQAASKFDDLMGKFENIDEELEYQGELIELLYGSQAYDLMDSLYDAQISNSLAQVDSLKQQADMWKELYDNAEEGSEEQAKYYEEWQEAQDNLNNSVIEHINLLKKDYSNALDKIIDNLEKELTGGLGLSEMRENWEEATAAADKYYDATERIYELETLESKFENAINSTSSLENQQKLKKLMDDQLADLKAKEKLTEYDITLAEKRLAIAQAEMALEDAQNAKNSMKLVRGANGNWEYQYIADEEDIAAKQQEMLDAYHNLYEYVKEVQQESVESILNMTEQFFTKMNEIRNDDSLSEEEKMIKMEELRNKYYGEEGKITVLQQEFADRTDDMNMANAEMLWGLYQADEDNYRHITETQQGLLDGFIKNGISDYTSLHNHISGTYTTMQTDLETALNDNMIPTWSSAAQTMAEKWNADDGESIKAQVSNALDAIDEKTKEYESKLDDLSEKSGKSFGEEGLTEDINKAVEATEKLNEVTEELCNDTITLLEDYRDAVKDIEQAWLDAYDAAMKALTTGDSEEEDSSTPASAPTTPAPQPTEPTGPGGNGKIDVGDVATYTGRYHYTSQGREPSGSRYAGVSNGVVVDKVNSNPFGVHIHSADGKYGDLGWIKPSQLSGYDTGGYTGEWLDGSGKLAMLHSKELVLNANDTENILEVVRLTRDMASLTSSVGSAVMNGVKMMLYDLMGMKAPGNNMVMTPQVADGNNIFNITAEFPNANDVTSIREAILSLPNMASQYLSQNKK